jgi:hypothetical protein
MHTLISSREGVNWTSAEAFFSALLKSFPKPKVLSSRLCLKRDRGTTITHAKCTKGVWQSWAERHWTRAFCLNSSSWKLSTSTLTGLICSLSTVSRTWAQTSRCVFWVPKLSLKSNMALGKALRTCCFRKEGSLSSSLFKFRLRTMTCGFSLLILKSRQPTWITRPSETSTSELYRCCPRAS